MKRIKKLTVMLCCMASLGSLPICYGMEDGMNISNNKRTSSAVSSDVSSNRRVKARIDIQEHINDLKIRGKDDPKKQLELGLIYNDSASGLYNPSEALGYFEKADTLGETEASYYLGLIYQEGRGVQKNYKKAFYYFNKASAYPDAQNYLGTMFLNGFGVKKDYNKAIKCFFDAAQQGHDKAIENISLLLVDNKPFPCEHHLDNNQFQSSVEELRNEGISNTGEIVNFLKIINKKNHGFLSNILEKLINIHSKYKNIILNIDNPSFMLTCSKFNSNNYGQEVKFPLLCHNFKNKNYLTLVEFLNEKEINIDDFDILDKISIKEAIEKNTQLEKLILSSEDPDTEKYNINILELINSEIYRINKFCLQSLENKSINGILSAKGLGELIRLFSEVRPTSTEQEIKYNKVCLEYLKAGLEFSDPVIGFWGWGWATDDLNINETLEQYKKFNTILERTLKFLPYINTKILNLMSESEGYRNHLFIEKFPFLKSIIHLG